MVNLVSKIHRVCFKFCSMVENKEKLLNLKLDDLQKHARKKKFLVFCSSVLVGDYYISNDSQH